MSSALRQPPVRLPLETVLAGRVDTLGLIGLRCVLTMHLEAASGGEPVAFDFVVDSGATHTVIGLEQAALAGLPVPPEQADVVLSLGTAQGATRLLVRPGRVRGWWDESCRGYPFDWPVLFRVDAPHGVPALLGLGGVLPTCRWTFDGSHSPNSPHGHLAPDDTR